MKLTERETKRILVVDDEKPIVELLRRRLEHWGFEVMAAATGEDGLKMAEREQPDLILLDIRLPEMNGREVCARLRARQGPRRIPVIFLTALGMPEQVEEGFKADPDDYILKPFEPAELKERVENCLNRY